MTNLSLKQLPHVLDITADSRMVKPGSLFVAIHGGTQDGHDFIFDVEKKGAVAVIGEKPLSHSPKIPYFQVSNSRMVLARLAAEFYGYPSHSMLMIGITGTSGKTTTSYLIESILKAAGHHVGVIGTVNFRHGSIVIPSTYTTPGPMETQALLATMKKAGCTAVVMEVSSHALKQRRVDFIAYDGMIFTNLSPEHLDFHPDMEDYFRSKCILFTELAEFSKKVGKNPAAVINKDDSYGLRLYNELMRQDFNPCVTFDCPAHFQVSAEGIHGEIDGIQIQSKLTGSFNVSNLMGALRLAQTLKISSDAIAQGLEKLVGVPGRLERVQNSRNIHVWVDYAHKADALEKVVHTLRSLRNGHRLITVFGCGGDRDRQKRPVMGKIAVELSDWVVITSDNPRTENPQVIIDEILKGTQGKSNFEVESDRRKAIFKAIHMARSGDLVLIAGKGHEDYQILGTQKVHFDDREVAAEAFL